MVELIDTFPAFQEFWGQQKDASVTEQINAWETTYMKPWPQLLEIQTLDYASQNLEWRQIAQENVFPYLRERLPFMQEAHQNLLNEYEKIFAKVQKSFLLEDKVTVVIYVGIGCGAGWVTQYDSAPAILFGLENIAECGWSASQAIAGLVAHEIGHLLHDQIRRQKGQTSESGSWWQLYSEGFAQYCESIFLEEISWHQVMGANENWLNWCRDNRSWLATEFLRRVDTDEEIRSFFGSWFEIQGRPQTGYYLGCEIIKELANQHDFEKIASLEHVDKYCRPILEKISTIAK